MTTQDQKLDTILAQVEAGREWQIRHEAESTQLTRQLTEHERVLFGERGDGLNYRVPANERRLDHVESNCRACTARMPWWQDAMVKILINVVSWSIVGFIAWQMVLHRDTKPRTAPVPSHIHKGDTYDATTDDVDRAAAGGDTAAWRLLWRADECPVQPVAGRDGRPVGQDGGAGDGRAAHRTADGPGTAAAGGDLATVP